MSEMQAFVSSVYRSRELWPRRSRRLVATLGHERLSCVAVELGEPVGDFETHWLEQNPAAKAGDAHFVSRETELSRQPYRLTPAIYEEFCVFHGGILQVLRVYTSGIYQRQRINQSIEQ